MASSDLNFKIIRDLGAFGEGKWQKHLTIINWNDKGEKYDIRPWNEDMTKMGKGVTLSKDDLYDLYNMIESELGLSDDDDADIDYSKYEETTVED